MNNIKFTDVDYRRYCSWGYRKRTRIWTNTNLEGKLCLGKGKCPNMMGGCHIKTAQRGSRIIEGGYILLEEGRDKQQHSQLQLYKIPPQLCQHVFNTSNT